MQLKYKYSTQERRKKMKKRTVSANRKLVRNFTLVEIMVVVVILVMLASIATPLYFNHLKNSRIATAKTQIALLEQALHDYRLDTGDYPEELEALEENIENNSKWSGPYIKPAVPQDPWGRDYVYINPGDHGEFDLLSYGKDGRSGGEGEDADITNYVVKD